jgi:hypothetical protein
MKTKTMLAHTIDTADDKARYDEACKSLLANKIILAWIMKTCLQEFVDIPVEEIASRYLLGKPQVGSVSVFPDEVVTHEDEKIPHPSVEDSTITEGTVRFDIKLDALLPEEGEPSQISLILNVEAQNEYNPGYPIPKRGIYYGGRLISSQKGTVFTKSDYGKIKKVCTIWICLYPPTKFKNTITRYHIAEENIVGHAKENPKNYDLIDVIMVYLGGDTGDDYEGILKLLDVLLTSTNTPKEMKKNLSEEFRIKMSREMESEVYKMCNFSEGIEQRGIAIGLKQGLEQGLEQGRDQERERLNQLFSLLLRDNRQDDLLRSTTDVAFQDQLIHEYKL